MNLEKTQKDERLFWPRTSEVVKDFAEAVMAPPEKPLSEHEKNQVLQFEAKIYSGQYSEDIQGPSLEALPSTTDTSFRVAPDYFLTDDGRRQLAEVMGVEPASLPVNSGAEAAEVLRSIPLSNLAEGRQVLEMLKADSLAYVKDRYQSMALGEEEMQDIETIDLLRSPERIVDKVTLLIEHKEFLRKARRDLVDRMNENPSVLLEAEMTILDIYRDRINAAIAEHYMDIAALIKQLEMQPQDTQQEYDESLSRLVNIVKTVDIVNHDSKAMARFARRLDYIRNGAARDEEGRLTPLDQNIFTAAEELTHRNAGKQTEESPVFSAEETQRLGEIIFDSLEMEAFLNEYLVRLGIADHGWTVEIRSDTDSLAVDGINKIVKIPKSYKRTVTQVRPSVGPIGLTAHEIGLQNSGHVFQSLNATLNPDIFKIASNPKLRGKRSTAFREAGAIIAESTAIEQYFGQLRDVNVAYAAAMKIKLQGGKDAEAVRAFAESHLSHEHEPTDKQRRAAYKLAADRVMRLTRFGGRNSQPLYYVEAANVRLVSEEMPDNITGIMFAEGMYDPFDMIRLHRYGLMPTDTSHFFKPNENPADVMTDILMRKLDEI